MTSPQPVHTDSHRKTALYLLSPLIALLLAVFGLLQGDLLSLLLGVGLGLFIWFTRHARYEIFHDRLVLRYSGPRRKVVPLAEIEEVRLVNFPMGGQGLVIRRRGGLGMVIRPTDPERFLAYLEDVRRGSAG